MARQAASRVKRQSGCMTITKQRDWNCERRQSSKPAMLFSLPPPVTVAPPRGPRHLRSTPRPENTDRATELSGLPLCNLPPFPPLPCEGPTSRQRPARAVHTKNNPYQHDSQLRINEELRLAATSPWKKENPCLASTRLQLDKLRGRFFFYRLSLGFDRFHCSTSTTLVKRATVGALKRTRMDKSNPKVRFKREIRPAPANE